MSPAPHIPPAQRELLRQALADAVYYQDPPVYCPACQTPDTLCQQCTAGLARAGAYLDLGRTLGLDTRLIDAQQAAIPSDDNPPRS
jgi:hypothetical protein